MTPGSRNSESVKMENMLEAHNMALRIKESTVRDDLDGYLSESSEGDDDFW